MLNVIDLVMLIATAVIGPGDVEIGDDDDEGASRGECEELRRACLHNEELGEEGQGNCRIYRETCRE